MLKDRKGATYQNLELFPIFLPPTHVPRCRRRHAEIVIVGRTEHEPIDRWCLGSYRTSEHSNHTDDARDIPEKGMVGVRFAGTIADGDVRSFNRL